LRVIVAARRNSSRALDAAELEQEMAAWAGRLVRMAPVAGALAWHVTEGGQAL
jgi:hypothetical protein